MSCECIHADHATEWPPGTYPPDVWGSLGPDSGGTGPTVTSISPDTANWGDTITVTFTGTGFLPPEPLKPCKMNIDYGTPQWVNVDATWVSDTEVTALWLVASESVVNLSISTGDVYSNGLPFTVVGAPDAGGGTDQATGPATLTFNATVADYAWVRPGAGEGMTTEPAAQATVTLTLNGTSLGRYTQSAIVGPGKADINAGDFDSYVNKTNLDAVDHSALFTSLHQQEVVFEWSLA